LTYAAPSVAALEVRAADDAGGQALTQRGEGLVRVDTEGRAVVDVAVGEVQRHQVTPLDGPPGPQPPVKVGSLVHTRCHGLLVIALTDDRGRLVWISAVRPGRTSEITACRHDKLTAKLRTAGLGAIADLGFVGLDDGAPDADPAVITGYKAARNRPLTRGQKLSNKALAAVRAPVEHGFAHLKNWRPRQGPHGSEVGDRAGAGPAGADEPGSRPLTDDLVGGLPPRTCSSLPTPTHTRPSNVQFS
jgi:hypothetical protein